MIKTFFILSFISLLSFSETNSNERSSVFVSPVGLITGGRLGFDYKLTNALQVGLEYSNYNYSIKTPGLILIGPSELRFSGNGQSYGMRLFSFLPELHNITYFLVFKYLHLESNYVYETIQKRGNNVVLLGIGREDQFSFFSLKSYVGAGTFPGNYDLYYDGTKTFLFLDMELIYYF